MQTATKAYNYIGTSNGSSVYLKMDYTYDHMGNVVKAVRTDNNDTANAVTITATYDMLGRMITSTDGKGNTTEYTYNVLGFVTNKKVPFSVDANGNMQYTNYRYAYDSVGNVTSDSITGGVTNYYTYDYKNRVTETKSGLETVNYSYDNVGNMTEYKTGNGSIHKYVYDNLNRVTKYTDALNQSETYTYDVNNDMTAKKDRMGVTTNYTYDGLHRLLNENVKSGYYTNTNTYVYGATGGIVSENAKSLKYNTTLSNTTKTYTYNNKGLVHKETVNLDGNAFMTERYYDDRGNLRYNFYRKNGSNYRTVQYNYNVIGLLSTVKENKNGGSYGNLVSYYYDKNDNLTSAHYGNGMYNVYYYNAANLVYCMDLKNSSSGTTYEHFEYKYNYDGNISSKKETLGGDTNTTTYRYNSDKLIGETVSGYDNFNISYNYDNGGNRASVTVSGDDIGRYTETYSYDKNNRLTGTIKNFGMESDYTEYTYDKNGNQTAINKYSKNNEGIFKLKVVSAIYKNNTEKENFSYNGLNQLVEYESTNGKYNGKTGLKVNYIYGADGYRQSKEINGKMTQYLWDNGNIASELNSEEVITESYTRGHQLIRDDSNTYYMHNLHGDVVERFIGTASTISNYTSFGENKFYSSNDGIETFGYCDQQYDWETGNYYMRARYYNTDTGRFISEDPIKDGMNWYSYCGGNPVMFWDPSGLSGLNKQVILQNTQYFRQSKDNNCWAANLSMIIAYYQKDNIDRQEEISSKIGLVNAPKRLDAVNIKLCNGKITNTYTDYTETPVMNLVLMEQQKEQFGKLVENEIDNGNPVIANFQNPNGGHFITIIGYEYKNGEMYIIYYDSSDSYNQDSRVYKKDDPENGDIGLYKTRYKDLIGGTDLGTLYSAYSYRENDNWEEEQW